ncbi:hypothetical protein J7438_00050 [Thalassotalea sp. G20_0]|uniref:hypothetical protein n=1 Tax=Thalassotalea sp. G20_0 TaxID=2821093 RepID=UPI001ADA2AD4|nr:hypothetical protein [Thalassotalea sp. G20_0]MBO9492491.1 hypothetical protein [Thalassotalea sp. G20_0]
MDRYLTIDEACSGGVFALIVIVLMGAGLDNVLIGRIVDFWHKDPVPLCLICNL